MSKRMAELGILGLVPAGELDGNFSGRFFVHVFDE